MISHYIIGKKGTPVGVVRQISTQWEIRDLLDTIKIRWSIGRMKYRVKPGLYAVGDPDENSDVFVTGNYKLSFDHLRRALDGMNAWVLILDSKGINVWCAAGKGTFGTKELAYRINVHEISKLVNHRRVIVPQLGAVGVSAHEVKAKTGFKVVYGPIVASDIKEFVKLQYKATESMRRVEFKIWDRLKLIPVELSYGRYYLLIIPAIFFILSGLNTSGYSFDLAWNNGRFAVLNLFTAYFSGCVFTPALLPWIPFRGFSLKGLLAGTVFFSIIAYFQFSGNNIIEMTSWFLIINAISSFLAMNFTGTSTYTSLSGVQKEMKFSLPIQILAAALGVLAWLISLFINI